MATAMDKIGAAVSPGIIKAFGRLVRWDRVIEGSYDPATSTADSTEQSYWVYAIVQAMRPSTTALIETGDRQVLIAGPSCPVPPAKGDRIAVGGESWGVVAATPIISGESVALWDLQVRQ